MKSITRKLGSLGRVTIPTTYLEALNLNSGDKLEVYLEGNKIIFKKPTQSQEIKKQAQDLIDAVKSSAPGDTQFTILRHLYSVENLLED